MYDTHLWMPSDEEDVEDRASDRQPYDFDMVEDAPGVRLCQTRLLEAPMATRSKWSVSTRGVSLRLLVDSSLVGPGVLVIKRTPARRRPDEESFAGGEGDALSLRRELRLILDPAGGGRQHELSLAGSSGRVEISWEPSGAGAPLPGGARFRLLLETFAPLDRPESARQTQVLLLTELKSFIVRTILCALVAGTCSAEVRDALRCFVHPRLDCDSLEKLQGLIEELAAPAQPKVIAQYSAEVIPLLMDSMGPRASGELPDPASDWDRDRVVASLCRLLQALPEDDAAAPSIARIAKALEGLWAASAGRVTSSIVLRAWAACTKRLLRHDRLDGVKELLAAACRDPQSPRVAFLLELHSSALQDIASTAVDAASGAFAALMIGDSARILRSGPLSGSIREHPVLSLLPSLLVALGKLSTPPAVLISTLPPLLQALERAAPSCDAATQHAAALHETAATASAQPAAGQMRVVFDGNGVAQRIVVWPGASRVFIDVPVTEAGEPYWSAWAAPGDTPARSTLKVETAKKGAPLGDVEGFEGAWEVASDDSLAEGKLLTRHRYVCADQPAPGPAEMRSISHGDFVRLSSRSRAAYVQIPVRIRRVEFDARAVRLTLQPPSDGLLQAPVVWVGAELTLKGGEVHEVMRLGAELLARTCASALAAVSSRDAGLSEASRGCLAGSMCRGGISRHAVRDAKAAGASAVWPLRRTTSADPHARAKPAGDRDHVLTRMKSDQPNLGSPFLTAEGVVSEDAADAFLAALRDVPADRQSSAALLHARLSAELKPCGGDDDGPSARLERYVVCALLRHHDLVAEATATAASGIPASPSLQLIWTAARKVRRWSQKQVQLGDLEASDEDALGGAVVETSPETSEFSEAVRRAQREQAVCVPLMQRVAFLLHELAPASSGRAVEEVLVRQRTTSDAGSLASPIRGRLSSQSNDSSISRMASSRFRTDGAGSLDGKWEGAAKLARSLEKRAKRLRRGTLRGRLEWSAKYGPLTSELLDFIEPGVREVARPTAAGLLELKDEMDRRARAVALGRNALSCLAAAVSSSVATLRLAALSVLARRPAVLRPEPSELHGCGHDIETSFTETLHALLTRLAGLLASPSRLTAEEDLVLRVLSMPLAAIDMPWLERTRLLVTVQASAHRRPLGFGRQTLYALLFSAVAACVSAGTEPWLWVVETLVVELSEPRLPPKLRLRLLQLLVLLLPSADQPPPRAEVSRLATPTLIALLWQLPRDDPSVVLCLRLLGRLLRSRHDASEELGGKVLDEIGAWLWRPAGALLDPAAPQPVAAGPSETGRWGVRSQVLRPTPVRGVLLLQNERPRHPSKAASAAPASTALQVSVSVALLEDVSSVAAYYLPSNSSPSLVQGVVTKLGSGRAADVTQALQAMAPAGATVEGGCIRVSTSDPALAVFLALQGGPLLGGGTTAWTNLGQVADAPWADDAASRFCEVYCNSERSVLSNGGCNSRFVADGTRLVEKAIAPNSGASPRRTHHSLPLPPPCTLCTLERLLPSQASGSPSSSAWT